MRKYYFKATKDDGVSGYDPNYRHKMGHNQHPNPDRKSTDPCGQGVHLAKTICDALNYVEGATEIFLATSTDVIASDKSKIRVGEYDILFKIPQQIIEEYLPKKDALHKEYPSKKDALDKEYQSKKDALDKEYLSKRDALDKEYPSKKDALDKEYQSKWDALDKEHLSKWDALDKEHLSKWDALDRKTLRKILRLYQKEK